LAEVVASPAAVAAAAIARESLAPHLLLNAEDFARVRTLARAEPWAEKLCADLVRSAEDWPANHVQQYGLEKWEPPAEGGGWSGHYICPDDGARLEFSPGHNRCPRCGKDYHGWPADYVVYLRRHAANAEAVRDLGLAFRLTGRAEFAAKARVVLLAYAALYPGLPIRSHKDWPTPGSRSGGRVTSQTLNESDWVRDMAFGYDLMRETLPAAERALIERDLLRNASDVIARRERSLGNWTARHNAAHLAVGLVTGDAVLVELALNAEFGLRDELRRGVSAEGQWREGSWGYHFYVLEPLFAAREMAARAGLPVPETPRLKTMLDAALACVLPDGTLPNFNDSGFTSLRDYARHFDAGYRLFGDSRYLWVVRGAPRGPEALWWGAAASGPGDLPRLGSTLLREAGQATLRAPHGDFTIALKFGEHGGGHGHFDKLNLVSFAFGRMQAVDPGTQSYAFRTHHTWDKVTLAHNTVVVDEATQAAATGELLEWHPGEIATAVRAAAGPVYPQAHCERLVVQTEHYALDVFEVTATDGAAHRFDWIYHNAGRLTTGLPLVPAAALPQQEGYQHLSHPQMAETSEAWQATFVQEGGAMRVWMLGAPATTVVTGEGLGQDLTVPVPFVMARRQGAAARFITLLEPVQDRPHVRRLSLEKSDVVVVESDAGTDRIGIVAGRFAFSRGP
jgi:hypothetical protein